jgi:transcriptional antiterminator RfaH
MAYWSAARLVPRQERLALHCLGLAGYTVYVPRLRERRIVRGRKIETSPLLFPGYCFVLITLQWHAAYWTPGVGNLIMNGGGPAHVPDSVIAELRSRERNGLIELPKPRGPRIGARVRVTCGVFAGQSGLYAGMKPRQRVEVLLTLLGGQQRVSLPRDAIEPAAKGGAAPI